MYMYMYMYMYIYIDPPTVALNYAAMFQTVLKLGCGARAGLCARGARISVQKFRCAGAPAARAAHAGQRTRGTHTSARLIGCAGTQSATLHVPTSACWRPHFRTFGILNCGRSHLGHWRRVGGRTPAARD